jgi:glycosyltransferase involved in cell wall biosynthesis
MEAQLGASIPQARIIDNPVDVPVKDPLPWPQPQETWRLASVGRIHFQSKGQDLILQALRGDKWKKRNLHVTFWGQDQGNLRQLNDLVDLFGLREHVSYGGYVDNMLDVWSTHHGLLLASRYEGNVLAGLEAQVCGRVPIVTKVGRNGELIDDDVTGFLAAAPTAELIDDALERAWQRRHEWKAIGQLAARRVRKLCDVDPCQTVHRDLESLTSDLAAGANREFAGQLLGNAA